MSTKPHFNVVICTPGHSLTAPYFRSFIETAQMLANKGISWAHSNFYASHVANAREMVANGGPDNDIREQRPFKGEFTYDVMVWIDSDISWTSEQFLALYKSDKDITSGMYLLADGSVTAFHNILDNPINYDEAIEIKERIKIGACGFGFLAVKAGVFESLKRPWFQSAMTMVQYDDRRYDFPIIGEDVSWCKRVAEQGYEIWLEPSAKVVHHKTVQLTWEGMRA
jgi:hypothetical protein